jgi:hypothetical protein
MCDEDGRLVQNERGRSSPISADYVSLQADQPSPVAGKQRVDISVHMENDPIALHNMDVP